MVPFQRHLIIYPRLILENLKSSYDQYILTYYIILLMNDLIFNLKKKKKGHCQKTKKHLIEKYKEIREKNV